MIRDLKKMFHFFREILNYSGRFIRVKELDPWFPSLRAIHSMAQGEQDQALGHIICDI